jgi:hypothetical protein
MAIGIRCPDHATPLYPQKLAPTSPTSGGCLVGIPHSRTKATELLYTLERVVTVEKILLSNEGKP